MKTHDGNRKRIGKVMPDWCQATGKWAHTSRESAQRHMSRLQSDGAVFEGKVYRCKSCNRWHVGPMLWRPSRRVGEGSR